MFSKVDYTMVNVSEMIRSVAFYRDVLGLTLKFESPGWTEFDTGTTTLALHLAEKASGAAQPPKGGPCAGTCSIGFSVTSLDEAFQTLTKRGARFVMPPMTQEAEGIRLAVCIDPDGLAVSFAEPLKK